MRRAVIFAAFTLFVSAGGCSRSPNYYVERGNRFFEDGKYEDAALLYQKAIQEQPNSGEAYYRLGVLETRRQNLPEAYQALTHAVVLMPQRDEVKIRMADVCLAGYQLDGVLGPEAGRAMVLRKQLTSIFESLLERNPDSFDGLRLKGLLDLSDRRPHDAAIALETAHAIEPLNREVALGLTQALLSDNRLPEAEKVALEVLSQDKAFGAIYDTLYYSYVGAGRITDAEEILKRKTVNSPKQGQYLVQLAEHYARVGKITEMNATLRRLLDNTRDFPDAHKSAGDFYARHLRWQEAIGEFEEAARSQPKEKASFQKRIVSALRAQGKNAEALQLAAEVIKTDPTDDEAQGLHASLLLETGKPDNIDAALAEFQKLQEKQPLDPVRHYNLGRAYAVKKKLDEAKIQFQEAVQLRENYTPPRIALVELELSRHQAHQALIDAKELFDVDPSNARGQYLYAAALAGTGNYGEARRQTERLLKQFPDSRDAHLELGSIAAAQKKFKEAEEIYEGLHKSDTSEDIRALQGLVNIYFAERQTDRALRLIGDDLKKAPDSRAIRRLLGNAAVTAGKYDLALEQYQQLLARSPDATDIRIRIADVYWRQGDFEKAISGMKQAVQGDPKNAEALMYLARILGEAGRMGEAKVEIQRVLALQPDNPDAMNDLAFVLSESGGNLDEALSLIERALQRFPNKADFLDTMGSIYLRKRLPGTAVELFNEAVSRQPNNPAFRAHLAKAVIERRKGGIILADTSQKLLRDALDALAKRQKLEEAVNGDDEDDQQDDSQ